MPKPADSPAGVSYNFAGSLSSVCVKSSARFVTTYKMLLKLSFLALLNAVAAHEDHEQTPISGPHGGLWYNTLPGDGGTQVRDEVRWLRFPCD